MTEPLSLRVEQQMIDALDEISGQFETSRSEVVRQMLWDVLEDESNEWTPPEHERILADRERVKHENKVRQLRGGFRSRIRRDLKRRFKNGWSPQEIRQTLPGYVAEADVLWPEDDEATERAEEITEELMERYVQAWETSEWDHDDLFSGFSGVQAGRESEEDERTQEEMEISGWLSRTESMAEDGVSQGAARERLKAFGASPETAVYRSGGVPADD